MTNPGGGAVAGGSTAGSSSAATGSGVAGTGFGNSDAAVQTSTLHPTADGGQQLLGDGSACQDGKFCAPNTPDQGCGTSTIKMTTTPGNLLIIFDQSGSMKQMWQTTTKLQAAQDALVAAITPLQNMLTVGAIFLPDPMVGCSDPTVPAVQPIDGPGNIPFTPGPQILTAFAAHWTNMGNSRGGGTPLNEAFDRADVALKAALPKLVGKVAVLIFTDGQPNCTPDPAVTGIPTETEPQHAADWLNQNILSFMVGLPGAQGVTLLNDVAINGGTMQYLTPDDPTMLADKLKEVIQQQISMGFDSCAIDLMPVASAPDKLQLVVEQASMPGMPMEVPHDLGGTGGWTVTPDGAHVELSGDICDAAKSGKFSKISFKFGCKDIPPIKPGPIN
jgi:hypothetical protein